MPFNRTITQVK